VKAKSEEGDEARRQRDGWQEAPCCPKRCTRMECP
jgi:hypothetical protein